MDWRVNADTTEQVRRLWYVPFFVNLLQSLWNDRAPPLEGQISSLCFAFAFAEGGLDHTTIQVESGDLARWLR